MTTIASELTRILDAKSALRASLINKGADVPSGTPLEDYPALVDALESGSATPAWVRPDDWLTMPTISATDSKVAILAAVYSFGGNDFSFTATGDFQVDWGDGTVETFSSGATASHSYTYSTHDVVGATICSRGYKQALIVITPQVGQVLTSFGTVEIIGAEIQPVLDLVIGSPNLSSFYIGSADGLGMCEHFSLVSVSNSFSSLRYAFASMTRLQSIELCEMSGLNDMYGTFNGCTMLQTVPLIDTSNVIAFVGTFYNCTKLQEIPAFDTSKGEYFSYFAANCQSLKVAPAIDTSLSTSLSGLFYNCASLSSVPDFDASNATSIDYMFSRCFSLLALPAMDTSNVTNMHSAFEDCGMVVEIPGYDLSAVTTTDNAFSGMYSVRKFGATGIAVSFSIDYMYLSADSLNEIFTGLPTVTEGQTISVGSTPGAATCNSSIATAKGWTVYN